MSWVRVPNFEPHPLFRGGHSQTIIGAYWPSRGNFSQPHPHRVVLPDGDRIVIHEDTPVGWRPESGSVLLAHGLGGSHASGYVQRMAGHLFRLGIRAYRMDMRGVGAGMYQARRWTHAGRSEDIAKVVERIGEMTGGAPLTLVGFSMGGNQVVKLVSEYGESPPSYLAKAIAVAPPVCLRSCSEALRRGLSRLYDVNFAKMLRRQVQLRRRIPGFHTPRLSPLPRSLRHFDQHFTAPLGGFEHIDDYYDRSSTRKRLDMIRVPTLILAAKNDPVVPISSFKDLRASSAVTVVVTDNGGHLGYIAKAGADPDQRWLDWRLVEQICGTEHPEILERAAPRE